MSNKLQNIKAIKQMLTGEHKSQKRSSTYFGSTKEVIEKEEVLEKFENGDPKVWIETKPNGTRIKVTQHDGFKSREPENSLRESIKEALHVPDNCPHCGTEMRSKEKKLNFKFWYMRKKCFSCVLTEEEKIKQQGSDAWKEYENKIMLSNAEGWFRDADKEVEILKTQIIEKVWENADGEKGEVDITQFIERMESDYLKLKDDIREKYS